MIITKSTNDQLMVMAAHRYCLGRQSYIVSACQEWLHSHWAQFSTQTKSNMVRDTLEELIHIQDDRGRGMNWTHTARWMWLGLDLNQRDWVTRSIAYQGTTPERVLGMDTKHAAEPEDHVGYAEYMQGVE